MDLQRDYKPDFHPWWLLWSVLFSAVWLIPSFSPPWSNFDRELVAGLLTVGLGGALLIASRSRWVLTPASLALLLAAVVPAVQWATGLLYFTGDAWIASLYLLGFSLAIAVGVRAAQSGSRGWPAALQLAIGVAAIVSVGIALKQWLQLDELELWTLDLPPGARPFANLGQPNLLATLLCWGLLAVWSAYLQGTIRAGVALLAAAYLLVGVAATQSRTSWLILAMFLAAAWVFRTPLGSKRYRHGLLLLLTLFIGLILGWSSLTSLLDRLDPVAPQSLEQRVTSTTRLQHWSTLLHALAERPVTGWGWNQVSVAQQAVAPTLPAAPELIDHSHDIVLDLLIWNGGPLGLLMVLLVVAWFVATYRRLESAKGVLIYLGVCAMCVHALLEYPHTYAMMLLPLGLMIGTLDATRTWRWTLSVPRIAMGFALGAGVAAVAITAGEYFEAKANTATLRFEMARVGPGRDSRPPELTLLTQLSAVLKADRLKITSQPSAEDVELMRKVAERFPAERMLVHYAAFAAARGDTAAAGLSLVKLCKLHPPPNCEVARRVWTRWGDTIYPWLRAVPFPEVRDAAGQ